MSDKAFLLIAALLSILCAIWAYFVTIAMATSLIINALFCFVMAFKIEKSS